MQPRSEPITEKNDPILDRVEDLQSFPNNPRARRILLWVSVPLLALGLYLGAIDSRPRLWPDNLRLGDHKNCVAMAGIYERLFFTRDHLHFSKDRMLALGKTSETPDPEPAFFPTYEEVIDAMFTEPKPTLDNARRTLADHGCTDQATLDALYLPLTGKGK